MPALRWAVSTGGFKPPSGIRESEWQENKSDEKDERLQQMELDNGWSLCLEELYSTKLTF